MLGLTVEDILFHSFAAIMTLGAVLVVFMSSPVYSALFLALTMMVLGAMFFTLEAYFVAAAQITVYAGAVMVLFVMVIMLFDLRNIQENILKISPLSVAKVLGTALLCGFLVGTSWLAVTTVSHTTTTVREGKPMNPDEDLTAAEAAELVQNQVLSVNAAPKKVEFGSTVALSERLFSKFVFAFEAVSLLLLVAIVGAVALARSRGGTHHVTR